MAGPRCDGRNRFGESTLTAACQSWSNMRVIITALALLMIGWPAQTTNADPYRWCAEYRDEMSGGASCYFHTLEQ